MVNTGSNSIGVYATDGTMINANLITGLSNPEGIVIIPTAADAPMMSLTVSTNNAVISWPAIASGFRLLQNTNLAGGNWLAVSNQSILSNGQNQVTLPVQPPQSLFRLVYR